MWYFDFIELHCVAHSHVVLRFVVWHFVVLFCGVFVLMLVLVLVFVLALYDIEGLYVCIAVHCVILYLYCNVLR